MEKRRSQRSNLVKKVQVTYTDEQGNSRFEFVQAQDISRSGCRVTLHFRCKLRSLVAVQLTPAQSGSATIRYQNPTPRGYVTGLEFLGGMEIGAPAAQ